MPEDGIAQLPVLLSLTQQKSKLLPHERNNVNSTLCRTF